MDENGYGFTCTDYEVISEDGSSKNKIINMPKVINYRLYLKNTIIQTVGVMIDTAIIKSDLLKMPMIRRRQDAATWCNILKNGFDCYGLNENLCSYRRVGNSLSSNKFKAVKGTWDLYRKIERLSLKESIFNFIGYAWNACKKRIYIKKSIKINDPKIEVAVSTMNLNDPIEFVKNMNIQTDAIIINQCMENTYNEFYYNKNKIRIFSYNERGLSKSRNRALENIADDTDIVLIADDKVKYIDGYAEIIKNAYIKNQKADVIAFNVIREGKDGRVTKKLPKRIGYISTFRVFSARITFNVNSIKSKNIRFDENFGTGTELYLGEDNIFISDCLKNKLNIYGKREVISSIDSNGTSTWFKGIDRKFLFVKGCCFKRIFGLMCYIYIRFCS
ncbi:MAG: hypothetical protein E7A06_11685 [Clostridiales bacterium]|jgi:hypothetical protein|nr:hypothetical protein [uncultured Intestinibacter sp.]MDU1203592.1 hypothetical protein [Clostridiales bacterium]